MQTANRTGFTLVIVDWLLYNIFIWVLNRDPEAKKIYRTKYLCPIRGIIEPENDSGIMSGWKCRG